MSSKRFLGSLDAADDQRFKNHFVESVYLNRILTNNSNIIYGSKGVGKTALRRALTEINSDKYFASKTIDLDQISFRMVHSQLSKITDTIQAEIPKLAQNIWRNVLAIYCIEAISELPSVDADLKSQIENLLRSEGFLNTDPNSRVLGQIEKVLNMIGNLGVRDGAVSPLGLPLKHYNLVNKFPYNSDLEGLLIKCAGIVKAANKSVLICIDGLDSIQEHTKESRQAIFAGLIDAIHKSSKDGLLSDAFCFKAFLPQELAYDAHLIIWDADKYIQCNQYIRWSRADFEEFLMRRLSSHSRTRSSNFNTVWGEFMPEKIRNDVHGKEEVTFNYILRHSLFRPRQILTHLQNILDRWDEGSSVFRVDPSFIPSVIASTNHDLATLVVNQLELDHPGLSTFMQSWNGHANTMSVAEFLERIVKYLTANDISRLHSVFDDMYNFGIFGVSTRNSIREGNETNEFNFGFVRDKYRSNLHASVDPDSILAISPMFHEYCGCIPSEFGIIIPAN